MSVYRTIGPLVSSAILPLPLIQEEQLSVNGERMCAKYWLPASSGLPRNSVDRITDRPDMTSAVDRGCEASTQTNKQNNIGLYEEIIKIIPEPVKPALSG